MASNPTYTASALLWIAASVVTSAFVADASGDDRPPTITLREVRWSLGDNPAWSNASFDDSHWERADLYDLDAHHTLFWLRSEVTLSSAHEKADEPLALFFSAMASCDFFWDGERLSSVGRPGTTAALEEPGAIEALVHLPAPLTKAGAHQLAARCSTFHRQLELTPSFLEITVGPYLAIAESNLTYSWLAMASLTAKFVGGIYFFALFFVAGRSRATLYLALLCLAAAGLLIVEVWRPLVGYTYDWHIPRLILVQVMAFLTNAFLVLFFFERFPAPGRRALGLLALVAGASLVFVEPGFDNRVAYTFQLGLALALVWGIGAIRRSATGSRAATAGVALCLVVYWISPDRFFDQGLFLALNGLIACLLLGHAAQARRDREELAEARLRSTRLELELVKKSIQPHFLMNSLTALAEWFEREPTLAAKGIEALSAEIRLLGDLADQRTVPIRREIELCQAHLAVMEMRRGCSYRLEVGDLDLDAPCPPGIIHTMIENAVTHGPSPREAARSGEPILIRLESTVGKEHCTYRLTSPLRDPRVDQPVVGRGTGLRYIHARLQEAFGDRFTHDAAPRGDSWVNEWSVPLEDDPTRSIPRPDQRSGGS